LGYFAACHRVVGLAYTAAMATSPREIDDRAFAFFCGVIRFVRTIRADPGVRRLADQMVSAAGSIPANREEATGASSRREFVRFNEIALRSAKESALWLRACEATGIGDQRLRAPLLEEAPQLVRILAAIIVTSKRTK
jgi:four helix bundle protein